MPSTPASARALLVSLGALVLFGSATSASAAPKRWIILSSHNHSHDSNEYSHDPDHTPPARSFRAEGVAALGKLAANERIDALALTDHNTVRGCHDPNFGGSGRTWLCGEELTAGSAHATLLFPDIPEMPANAEPFHPYHMLKSFCDSNKCFNHRSGPSWNLPDTAFESILDQVHSRGAFTILNHPRAGLPPMLLAGIIPRRAQARMLLSWSWPYDSTLGVDGLEVGLPVASRQHAAVRYWDEQLRRGVRLTGVTGTDFHYGSRLQGKLASVDHWVMAIPLNAGYFPDSTAQRRRLLLDALGQGRVQVLAHASIETRVELDVNLGATHYGIGDTVDLSASSTSDGTLTIQVSEPRGGRLVLIRDGQPWGSPIKLPSAPSATFRRPISLRDIGYLRAEVYPAIEDGGQADVLTNPIYWTRQEAKVTARVTSSAVKVDFAVPASEGVAIFLTPEGHQPYGASDPQILARAVQMPRSGRGYTDMILPPPGRYTVSVIPLNATGEMLNYRLPAMALIDVPPNPRVAQTLDNQAP